jgi:cytosine/adenosine deaminase-related metal-dependent hydrolase
VIWPRVVTFVNGRVATGRGVAQSLRFASTILSVDEPPRRGDKVVDLAGSFVLPGLINGHDHLELNHYGRLKFRESYTNVSEWIDDMRPRLRDDPGIRAGRGYRLAHRLFIGALKNLLAGVTMVAHHNPFYRELRRGFPIRVVRRYGWAHSFALERAPAGAQGEAGGDVAARHRATPANAPFFVHLAEGVDAMARGELERLDRLKCLRSNVVLVHGVAIDPADWPRVVQRRAGLVWCPGSNLFLFDRTAQVRRFLECAGDLETARVALGTDSRLSGERDLLDELRVAAATSALPADTLLGMVSWAAADLLRQPGAGRIVPGGPADLIVIPNAASHPAAALLRAARRDVRLVIVGGRPLVGDPACAEVFAARGVATRPLVVDAAPKVADAAVVRRMTACGIAEPGVDAA